MLTVTFFGRFSVCFSSVFTAQIFLREKQTKNKMKNSQKTAKKRYCEPPPPEILEKQLKNKFQMSSA
jgi:hypothetical protein